VYNLFYPLSPSLPSSLPFKKVLGCEETVIREVEIVWPVAFFHLPGLDESVDHLGLEGGKGGREGRRGSEPSSPVDHLLTACSFKKRVNLAIVLADTEGGREERKEARRAYVPSSCERCPRACFSGRKKNLPPAVGRERKTRRLPLSQECRLGC